MGEITMLDADDAFERWDSDRPARVRAWTAVAVASTSQLLYMVDAGLIALSLPEIEKRFSDVPRSTIGWAATGFLVAQSSLLLVGGRVGDRHGRKRFFLLGMTVFTLGVLLTALAPNIWFLIGARVVQGCGAAFLTSGALALVLPMFPPLKSAVVIGAWGMVGSVAAWGTPTVGSLIIERSWRLGFLLVVPIGSTAIVLGRRVLVDTALDRSRGPTDRVGYVVGPPALGLTMLVLANATHWGWTSTITLALGAIAAALLAVFLWRSRVADSPLLDLAIMRHPAFARYTFAGALQQMGFFAWFLTAPLIMAGLWGWSVRQVGLALALGQVLAMFGSPLGGQVVIRWGSDVAIVIGAVVNVVAMGWIVLTMSAAPEFWWSYLPMALLFGFGSGMCGTVTTGAALAALPSSALGAGNSIVQLVRRMGGALGVAVGLALLGEAGGPALLDGARRAWVFTGAIHLAIVAALLLGALPRRLRLQGQRRLLDGRRGVSGW
jgi:EmrB/QacA subfamily drug resistance transporter